MIANKAKIFFRKMKPFFFHLYSEDEIDLIRQKSLGHFGAKIGKIEKFQRITK